ncbi:tyrosine-type recombinase/integrase [Sphaerotilus sp.]|uniref:tyrosine-type recombinase/integrase n=1 Tax=Sphaerotilus sp. TaxID=2093942 RepID=UPI0025D3E49B|nr:integrase arm-type DNA-binding domain-containing protein [Sphaerotilus sp.]
MARMILTDAHLRGIKAQDPRKRLTDGGGLYLLLFVKGGSHAWRFDYSHEGKRKTLSLGTYPDTGLSLARRKADEARRLLAEGINPSTVRKEAKTATVQALEDERRADAGLPALGSFEEVARSWFDVQRGDWAATYANKVIRRLELYAFPYIGRRPVGEITPPELLAVLRRLEARGVVETAHRVRDTCSQVFRFAVAEGRVTSDPARDLAGALRTHQTKHIPAITDPARFGELLRAIDGCRGIPATREGLKLAALLFLRPGAELRAAEWSEFDLDAALWAVPATRMKRRKHAKENGPPHLVPLPRQAVEILRELRRLTGHQQFVFQGVRDRSKTISENTLNAALSALGFGPDEMRMHGFRAAARTMLAERLNFDDKVIEAQLAHAVPDALGRAYNRTQFVEQRREMLQVWADYLDRLRQGAQVIPIRAA